MTKRITRTMKRANGTKSFAACTRPVPGGLAGQFDFTATPRHSKGQLFTWTIFDYPLKQAIIDNVVKRPLKGIAQGIVEQRSDIASTRYQAYLAAGVERWKEYREQLQPLGKKPVLFVMMNDTDDADDVGDWLQKKYPVGIWRREAADHSHRQVRATCPRKIWTKRARLPAKSMTRKARSIASSAC